MDYDLFGNPIEKDFILRDKFIEPPFSILDSKGGEWQNRKRQWKSIGMKSEVGRSKGMTFNMAIESYKTQDERIDDLQKSDVNTSIFDPALCELLYTWFCPSGGAILDPFAGGSVRGIVANKLGYKYTGIDIRQEQIDCNRNQALDILSPNNQPQWYCGDSDIVLNDMAISFDLLLSCPPYADLEVYSDLEGDISNMPYDKFMTAYESIVKKSCNLLKRNSYACFIVGEVRDKNGYYLGFVPDTIRAFEKAGLKYYNEAILLSPIASASMRADKQFSSAKKLVKIHQNILVFKKP